MTSMDEGLGTAYERMALAHCLVTLARRHGWQSVAEVPANGVLGLPGLKSLPLARLGLDVTLVHPGPEVLTRIASAWSDKGLRVRTVVGPPEAVPLPDGCVDLGWSFCALERSADPATALRELGRISKRHILLFVQNWLSPGIWLHALIHRRTGEPWDHGRLSLMSARAATELLGRALPGARVVERGGVDLPPWSDINMRAADLLPSLVLGRRPRTPPGWEQGPTLGPGPETPSLPRVLHHWYRGLEQRVPRVLAALLAHHPYILVDVRTSTKNSDSLDSEYSFNSKHSEQKRIF